MNQAQLKKKGWGRNQALSDKNRAPAVSAATVRDAVARYKSKGGLIQRLPDQIALVNRYSTSVHEIYINPMD